MQGRLIRMMFQRSLLTIHSRAGDFVLPACLRVQEQTKTTVLTTRFQREKKYWKD